MSIWRREDGCWCRKSECLTERMCDYVLHLPPYNRQHHRGPTKIRINGRILQ